VGTRLAEAAQIEEGLSERCLAAVLDEKAWSHRLNAASCWAQAGNLYQAIAWCDDLLAQTGLLTPVRHRVGTYVQELRARRARLVPLHGPLELQRYVAEFARIQGCPVSTSDQNSGEFSYVALSS
jgi:hypothetical protein